MATNNKKTTFRSKESFQKDLIKVCNTLLDDYENISEVFNERMVNMSSDSYHYISQLLSPPYTSSVHRSFCSGLYKIVHQAELLCHGAGEVAFTAALCMIFEFNESKMDLSNEARIYELFEAALIKLKSALENSSKPMDMPTMLSNVKYFIRDNRLSAAVTEALKLSGLEGRIFVENGKTNNYVIELKEGYSFDLRPYKFFLENGKWESFESKVMVVDGFVENISEIDQVLNQAYEKKQPMSLIALGFSEEVVATLYTNFKNGNLNVVPLRLMPDINNLNVINDIGICCGSDPVSSLKGQLLSFVKWDDLKTVDKILATEFNTTIQNPATSPFVFNQIKQLVKKRDDNKNVEDIQVIIDKRIRSLMPNSVVMYLPDMTVANNESVRLKIDQTLRAIKDVMSNDSFVSYRLSTNLRRDSLNNKHGGKPDIVSNEFEKEFFSIVDKTQYVSKLMIEEQLISPMSAYIGLKFGFKYALMMLCANGIIEPT